MSNVKVLPSELYVGVKDRPTTLPTIILIAALFEVRVFCVLLVCGEIAISKFEKKRSLPKSGGQGWLVARGREKILLGSTWKQHLRERFEEGNLESSIQLLLFPSHSRSSLR